LLLANTPINPSNISGNSPIVTYVLARNAIYAGPGLERDIRQGNDKRLCCQDGHKRQPASQPSLPPQQVHGSRESSQVVYQHAPIHLNQDADGGEQECQSEGLAVRESLEARVAARLGVVDDQSEETGAMKRVKAVTVAGWRK
ncbi:MAG: hypothetical protein LQ341_004815, partial [Variospora aurantia]